jgi:hypothetical protein
MTAHLVEGQQEPKGNAPRSTVPARRRRCSIRSLGSNPAAPVNQQRGSCAAWFAGRSTMRPGAAHAMTVANMPQVAWVMG